jgi:hypothetical protein
MRCDDRSRDQQFVRFRRQQLQRPAVARIVIPLAVRAIGIRAPGLPGWSSAQPVLAGTQPYVFAAMPPLAVAALPVTERRRANETSRLALAAAMDATRAIGDGERAALRTVFASADGDGEVLASELRELAQPLPLLSPTTFHNSVFNAPAGYWSIAAQAEAASTTICGGPATFAVGLLEAVAQATTGEPVLLVAYDHAFPADAPLRGSANASFACALLLQAADRCSAPKQARLSGLRIDAGSATAGADTFSIFAGNAAAAALPLLAAIARGADTDIALPLDDAERATVEVRCS